MRGAAADGAVENLGRRALNPWLAYTARQPAPTRIDAPTVRGGLVKVRPPQDGAVKLLATRARLAELLATSQDDHGEGLKSAIRAHFLVARRGSPVHTDGASALWDAIRGFPGRTKALDLHDLGGRGLCDLLYVLSCAKDWAHHESVSLSLVDALCATFPDFELDLLMWPQALPLVAEYLSQHCRQPTVATRFLGQVLGPFWHRHPEIVKESLLSHHALAVSMLISNSGRRVPQDVKDVVRKVVSDWTVQGVQNLRPRGLASIAIALSRVAPGPGGEKVDSRLLKNVMVRATKLVEQSECASPGPFRPDWLGMLMCSFQRGRYRGTGEGLRLILAAHLLRRGNGLETRLPICLPGESQNLALIVHALVKLDVHRLQLDPLDKGTLPLAVLAPAVQESCKNGVFKGAKGARSQGLISYSYGSAMLLDGTSSAGKSCQVDWPRLYEGALREMLGVNLQTVSKQFLVRFQMLCAVQFWWCAFGGPNTPIEMLRRVNDLLASGGTNPIPSGDQSAEGTDWISTREHEIVMRSLPREVVESTRVEEFAFPFWLDIVLPAEAVNRVAKSITT